DPAEDAAVRRHQRPRRGRRRLRYRRSRGLPGPVPAENDHRLQARRDRQAPRHRGFVECAFMTATLTWSGITARRMVRHALAEPAADLGPAAVAGLLCGAHAQVLSAAELSRRAADRRGDPRRRAARALAGT